MFVYFIRYLLKFTICYLFVTKEVPLIVSLLSASTMLGIADVMISQKQDFCPRGACGLLESIGIIQSDTNKFKKK